MLRLGVKKPDRTISRGSVVFTGSVFFFTGRCLGWRFLAASG
jgi:hypothetical protein